MLARFFQTAEPKQQHAIEVARAREIRLDHEDALERGRGAQQIAARDLRVGVAEVQVEIVGVGEDLLIGHVGGDQRRLGFGARRGARGGGFVGALALRTLAAVRFLREDGQGDQRQQTRHADACASAWEPGGPLTHGPSSYPLAGRRQAGVPEPAP